MLILLGVLAIIGGYSWCAWRSTADPQVDEILTEVRAARIDLHVAMLDAQAADWRIVATQQHRDGLFWMATMSNDLANYYEREALVARRGTRG